MSKKKKRYYGNSSSNNQKKSIIDTVNKPQSNNNNNNNINNNNNVNISNKKNKNNQNKNNNKKNNVKVNVPNKDIKEVINPNNNDVKENAISTSNETNNIIIEKEVVEQVNNKDNIVNDEAKKVEEVKYSASTNVISFIIALLIIVGIGFAVYMIFGRIPNVNNSSNKTTTTTTTNESTLSQKQINDLGESLFNWMNNKSDKVTSLPIFFTMNNLDVNNFDNNSLLNIAYFDMTQEDKNITNSANNECVLNNSTKYTYDTYPDGCYQENFDQNILGEQIRKHFSSKLKYSYLDFVPSGSVTCALKNKQYKCFYMLSDMAIDNRFIITSIDHTVLNNNKIEVYSRLIAVKRDLDIYKQEERGIYKDIDCTQKIDDLTYFNEINKNGLDKAGRESIINKYKDSSTLYKSTFVNENGNYVWESTELMR